MIRFLVPLRLLRMVSKIGEPIGITRLQLRTRFRHIFRQEEALEREREDARRYRMRLVPRVSSVTCASMNVSLPPFIVAAASGSRR